MRYVDPGVIFHNKSTQKSKKQINSKFQETNSNQSNQSIKTAGQSSASFERFRSFLEMELLLECNTRCEFEALMRQSFKCPLNENLILFSNDGKSDLEHKGKSHKRLNRVNKKDAEVAKQTFAKHCYGNPNLLSGCDTGGDGPQDGRQLLNQPTTQYDCC